MTEHPVFWIIGLIAMGLASSYVVRHYFNTAARMERKRRKNHSPIVTKAKGRLVLFSVKTPKS